MFETGPMVRSNLNNIKDFNDGKNKFNIYLYGVHDKTLLNLLRINKFNGELLKPGLGAILVFENRKTDENSPAMIRVSHVLI